MREHAKHTLVNDPATTPIANSWDAYWRGTQDSTAYSSDGVGHPAIRAFWQQFLGQVRRQYPSPRIVDVAAGNGAVGECVYAAFDGALPEVICLDISAAAVRAVARRFPGVHGIVADARAIPLPSAEFAIVTSQFGIEYAGREALAEAARLTAPGGHLALLLHSREGGIYRECAASLDAIRKLQRAEFIPLAIGMFEAGFASCNGAGHAPYQAAAIRLQTAFRAIESIMLAHGQQVAGGTVLRLYNDIARMHRDLRRHDQKQVLEWLRSMDMELRAYAGRMASMCAAAIDRETFDGLCSGLRHRGYRMRCAEALALPDQLPLAWALIAERF